ncbi:hypothetical protein C7974DRAFT_414333 [Boeremia exigua]|uniref:uncharacterized protein n=1 Tax=Boeremia exigua TaxID=749465 RepID=UPI001E8D4BCE|nr:uncharacterized protein C7974DRAFT_414333 [Boeremia exigua]KAH6625851.1 hypothetical protein C7974DRAFT_414333 [Boeremia exigua]
MQVPVGGAVVAQTSRLLAIPGEIRNRIYELAIEDANAWQDEDFDHITHYYQRQNALLDQRRRNVPLLRKTSSASQDWCSPKRPYLGLTQVCRQLRAEFLGLHSNIRICVALEATADYLNDVVAMQANDPESAVGCIDVRISFVWELREMVNISVELDDVYGYLTDRVHTYTELEWMWCLVA